MEGWGGEWILGFSCTRLTPISWLKERGWLKGCVGVDGEVLVGVVEI